MGHRPGIKGGYFPVPPVDSLQDIRSAMCLALEEMGLTVEVHHHEVATAGQCEIGVAADTLVKKADDVQILKYACRTSPHGYGKTADVHAEAARRRQRQRHARAPVARRRAARSCSRATSTAACRDIALYYIGGIIKHAHAINAFTNACTNSYKRLVPGFEAPVMLAYSARNRSASIRIPWVSNPKGRRIEVRFPDCTANPVLRVRRDDDGRSRRHPEQDPPGRAGGQGSVRPAAGRGRRRFRRSATRSSRRSRRSTRIAAFLKAGGVFTRRR